MKDRRIDRPKHPTERHGLHFGQEGGGLHLADAHRPVDFLGIGFEPRIGDLGPDDLAAGVYRIWFGTGDYFARDQRRTFYPEVTVTFEVEEGGGHYHVPLTLSPFAYSTYRGS